MPLCHGDLLHGAQHASKDGGLRQAEKVRWRRLQVAELWRVHSDEREGRQEGAGRQGGGHSHARLENGAGGGETDAPGISR